MTRFDVRTDVLSAYEKKIVGGREHEEYWVPAEELDAFNAAIVGKIEVTQTFGLATEEENNNNA
ncbi:ADP-ribosylglycohydrolase [Asticcacaulis excentricus]|uniref:ADP-ribosylglycohydrolase n=1 Tax=Asticcacaulis excentricus TaxID=78587 RepID=A0A3G9GAP0_9CAUL|nr:ADP-ribosylglycohydrolase [Asticcacaulis excentricus]